MSEQDDMSKLPDKCSLDIIGNTIDIEAPCLPERLRFHHANDREQTAIKAMCACVMMTYSKGTKQALDWKKWGKL